MVSLVFLECAPANCLICRKIPNHAVRSAAHEIDRVPVLSIEQAEQRTMRARRAKSDRQARILAELNRAPSLRVADLAEHFEVSTETIRRDLDELTEQGLLNRTYGGAVRPLSSEPSLSERHSYFIAERERIACAAVHLIKTGRVFIMGSGATTVHVARRSRPSSPISPLSPIPSAPPRWCRSIRLSR